MSKNTWITIAIAIVLFIGAGILALKYDISIQSRDTFSLERDESYLADIKERYFSFPGRMIDSYGINEDAPEEIAKYEEASKEKEAILLMDFTDAEGKEKSAYVKKLALSDENIEYTLRHYTNYFASNDLAQTAYTPVFSIDMFKSEDFKKPVNASTIVTSPDAIFIIMSDDTSVDSFMNVFSANNYTDGTFIEYLQNNPDVLARVLKRIEGNKAVLAQSALTIQDDMKAFAADFWNAWVRIDRASLGTYYADRVWLHADEGWFGPEKAFVDITNEQLVQMYTDGTFEGHDESVEQLQALASSIELYPANEFMKACYAEDKNEFFTDLRIAEGDTFMIVRLDGGVNCSAGGKFLKGESRFWVIRSVDGASKIVTDFTE